ncbi:MAG: PASTA domain-containing protein, partial [Clostridiales bacterium]|nr:PASTA domain-containing protein [Clostridiales bacterium]
GNNPIDSLTRSINDKLMIPARLAEQIPAYVINAMGNALQIHPADRTRTVEQLRNQLSAAPSEAASNSAVYRQEEEPEPEYEEEEDDDTAPAADRRRIIIMSVIAVVLVAAIGVLTYFLVRDLRERQDETETTTQAEMLPVPNFIDYTETEVENNSDWASNFVFEKEYVFDNEAEAGVIIAQSPESNSNVNRGSTIKLTVSKGKETVYLSNFVGVSEEIATAQLEEAGFNVQTATKYNDGSGREGLVYEQSLDSGQS